MKKNFFLLMLILFTAKIGFTQQFASCENVTAFNKSSSPDLGIVISSGDEETVWNAVRLGIAAQSKGDTAVIFVINKGVDVFMNDSAGYDIPKTIIQFVSKGGNIYTCATCASRRHTDYVQMCTITSVYDLYEIIKRSKKVVTF